MEIGVSLPTTSSAAWDPGLAALARQAEEEGAASLWVNDHLAMVRESRKLYPYSADGRMTWAAGDPQLEALTCLAHVAAVTTTARLGTAVLVLPQRHPVALAKTAATLDVLSSGRLVLGVGAGWLAEEMQALGFSFEDRGSRMEECMRLMRYAWQGHVRAMTGDHFTIPTDLWMHPTPVQPGGPPLLVGGVSGPARRRAARTGDGWLAVADVGQLETNTFAAHLKEISDVRQDAGRTGRFTSVLKLNCADASVDDTTRAVATAQEAGFDEVVLDVPWQTPGQVFTTLRTAAAGVA